MNPRETLELDCSEAWSPVVSEPLGTWQLRWADGFTGRANSALAVGDPGLPISDTVRAVCDFSHSRGIQPRIQAIKGSDWEAALEKADWMPDVDYPNGHEVSVLLGPPGDLEGASIREEPTPAWWELTAGSPDPSPAQRHVLSTGKIGYGVLEFEGGTVGAVRGALVGDLLHISRLAVRPEHRRRGHAAVLMSGVGAWARRHGATRCVLQVSVANAPALALYAGLGFTEHHRYRYWVPAPACEDRSL